MIRLTGNLALGALLCIGPSAVWAGVIVNSSISLESLTATPSSGASGLSTAFGVTAFAQAGDSITAGFPATAFDLEAGTAAIAGPVASSLAAAFGIADPSSWTGTASSSISIPNITASASSVGQSQLGLGGDYIVITGGTGPSDTSPVDVTFSATLTGTQTLATPTAGVYASSEIDFQLLLLNAPSNQPCPPQPAFSSGPPCPVLYFDSPLSIGPDQFLSSPYSATLTSAPVPLQLNTQYFIVAALDSESSGVNAVPEPSCLLLVALGTPAFLLLRRRAR